MSWRKVQLAVILIVGILALVHNVALAVIAPYKSWVPEWLGGMTNADITVTATPNPGDYTGPPLNFTATYVSDNTVALAWDLGVHAENTTIRAKWGGSPGAVDDGYLVFDGAGTSTNDTALSFDVMLGTVYYAAWSENATGGFSASYATAQLENPWMVIIAEYFPTLVLILISGLLCALAYWRDDMWLYITAGIGAMFLGFSVIELNVGIGLVIILFGIYTIIRAMLAWRKRGIV